MKRSLARIGLVGLAILGVLAVVVACAPNVGESLFYQPHRGAVELPSACDELWLETADDVRLHACFLRGVDAPSEPGAGVVVTHGNAGHMLHHLAYAAVLARAGFHVLLFDYRGYGRSDDEPVSRDRLVVDTRAALESLARRPEVDPTRIGVFGVSLGGQPALQLAVSDPRIRAVATLATFSTWEGVARDHFGLLGVALIAPGLDAIDAVARLGARPYWIGHGGQDRVVPVRHAGLLADAAREAEVDVRFELFAGRGHNDVVLQDAAARRSLAAFFTRALGDAR